MGMQIIVDSREPECMSELLADKGFEVYVQEFPVGDYIVLGPEDEPKLYFTLKSNNDLMSSIYSNHMHNEIYNMLMLPKDVFIAMVVWDEKYIGCSKGYRSRASFVRAQVKDRLVKINALYMPVIRAKDRDGAVDAMWNWSARLYGQAFPTQYRRRIELVGDNKMDQIKRLYMTLPGIGEQNVEAMMTKYESFGAFLDDVRTTKDYDKAIHGTKKRWAEEIVWYHDLPVGPVSAERMYKILLGDHN